MTQEHPPTPAPPASKMAHDLAIDIGASLEVRSIAQAHMMKQIDAALAPIRAALEKAKKQLGDLDDVLNQPNHYVVGWHLNGDHKSVASFFEDNDCGAFESIDSALALLSAPAGEGTQP